MAPGSNPASLERRTYYCDYYGNCYSNWDYWGRWVALAVILVVAFLLLFAFSSRRRRRRGQTPMYGTGWMAGSNPPPGHYNQPAPGYYANNDINYATAAPPYTPAAKNNVTGNTFTSGEGYYGQNSYNTAPNPYGGQQSGIELQAPQSTYQPARGGDPVYDAPPGPPPGKGDGVIR